MADLIPVSELPVNGCEVGVNIGVRGGFEKYRPGGFQERPVTVNAAVSIPGTTLKPCRHAETCLASGTYGSNVLTVNDGSLLVVGNKILVSSVIRSIIFSVTNSATASGNVTVTIKGEQFVISIGAGTSGFAAAAAIRDTIPGFAPSSLYGGSNPYFLGAGQSDTLVQYKDADITTDDISIDWGTTGLGGWAFVPTTLSNYIVEITAISGDNVTVAAPVGTSFTDKVLSIDNFEVLQLALNAAGPEETAYVPPGLYVLSNGVNVPSYKTLRGGGSFIQSKQTVTIGTGLKTFSDVVDGIDYEVGCGIRIERRQLSDSDTGSKIWMQGRVVSYSGGVLQVNVTATDGAHDGMSFSDWRISVTMFLFDGSGPCVAIGGTSDGSPTDPIYPVSALARGDTSFTTAAGAGGNFYPGAIVSISILNNYTTAELAAGKIPSGTLKGYGRAQRFTAHVTSVSGDVVHFEPPIDFDCPADKVPWVRRNNGTVSKKAGAENLAIRGRYISGISALASIGGSVDCWFYDVEAFITPNYGLGMFGSVFCEFNRCWTGWRTGSGSNGSGVQIAACTRCLFVDTISYFIGPGWEINDACVACAVAYSYTRTWIDTNHSSGQNQFIITEGNDCDYIIPDGYHGGSNNEIILRNRVTYRINLKRFSRKAFVLLNCVGELGQSSGYTGLITMGQPLMGAESNVGVVEPSAGNNWPEFEVGYVGTITNRISDQTVEVTLTSDAGLNSTNNSIGAAWWDDGTLSWPPGVPFAGAPVPCAMRDNVTMTRTGPNTIALSLYAGTPAWPAAGTALRFWPGSGDLGCCLQLDLDVANSSFQKGNVQALVGASSWEAQQPIPAGETPIDSLLYPSGRPAWLPAGFPWPPFNPADPTGTALNDRIPSTVRVHDGDGVLPIAGTPPAAPSGLSATAVSSSQINLGWTDNTAGANGHKVYRGTASGDLSLVATLAPGVTTFNATGLSPSTEYFFAVRSFASGGAVSAASNEANATTQAGAPVVATPTFTPAPAAYGGAQLVTISCATADAVIHFTTDGSTPTASSPVYSAPINITVTTTLRAIAMHAGMDDSGIRSGLYTIGSGVGGPAIPTLRSARAPRFAIRGS